jgi:hypothetical protein
MLMFQYFGPSGSNKSMKIKYRPENCSTCKHSRQRIIGKEVRLVCANNSPRTNRIDGLAVWPIVEPNDWCNKHEYDNRISENQQY